jgi:predicted metal-dependent hydrolase
VLRMKNSIEESIAVFWANAEHIVRIRNDVNARRMTLRIRPAKRDVLLSIPNRVSRARAIEFANLNVVWIHEKLSQLPPIIELVPDAIIPIRGERHRIIHVPESHGTAWIAHSVVENKPALFVAGQMEHSRRRIKNFLFQLARSDLTRSVTHYCNEIGANPPKITLRDTSSRWGSCSNKGGLNFSWRLIFAPPVVLDYLAAHEVTHLLELNHSERFWKIVATICDNVEEAERWLRDHGASLHSFQ